MSVLADRAEVHRSCKSLETLLSVLNDYCEAAGAVVTLQKKLVKALRETAGLKVTGEIPANAMNASADIFEALSEIDAKFAKILDKEYDGVSAEVRKWFKKLAKEEKTHDERINNANARIKQAGQLYEKKAKKSARDAVEEHTKYISLITALGPEISQEKYNHTLQVTQRHTATTYDVAACLSRMADAEWVRSCEEVRRFSPTIGQLGEWRALCEGGWTGPLPQDLPNLSDDYQGSQDQSNAETNWDGEERRATVALRMVSSRDSQEIAPNNMAGPSPIVYTNEREQEYLSVNRTSNQQQKPEFTSADPSEDNTANRLDPPATSFESEMNSGSVRSLSAFPSPPTHLPLPISVSSSSQPSLPQTNSQSWTSSSSSPTTGSSGPLRLVESPKQVDTDLSAVDTLRMYDNGPPSNGHPPDTTSGEKTEVGSRKRTPGGSPEIEPRTPQANVDPSYQHNTQKTSSPASAPTASGTWRKGDYVVDEREFGADKAGQPTTIDAAKSKTIERRDTSGSLVSAMRNRYSYTSGTTSPVPKDVPRLPLSVTDLASRYQTIDDNSLSQRRAASPTNVRPLPYVDSFGQTQIAETSVQERSPGVYKTVPASEDADVVRRRRQRIEELAELELKEKELELRAREREIEMRARELERDRVHLMTSRGDEMSRGDPQSIRSQRPVPGRYSYSTTHLVPPPDSRTQEQQTSRSQESSPVRLQPRPGDHAPYCGCDQCSVAKYKTRNTAPSPHDLRPPERPISLRPEKAKGSWMRRLSMPVMVGNAFSSDTKKNSTTILRSPNVGSMAMEDGRLLRRSFESSNRSVTNLGRR